MFSLANVNIVDVCKSLKPMKSIVKLYPPYEFTYIKKMDRFHQKRKKRVGHIPTEKRGYNSMLIYPFITTTSHYEPLTNHDNHQLL